MEDLLLFRRMISPGLIIIGFWVGVFGCIVYGVWMVADAEDTVEKALGILLAVVGPLVVRIQCEWAILFFRMNETLTEILQATEDLADQVGGPEGEEELAEIT